MSSNSLFFPFCAEECTVSDKNVCSVQRADPPQSVPKCFFIQSVAPDSSFIVTAFTNRPLRGSGISLPVR